MLQQQILHTRTENTEALGSISLGTHDYDQHTPIGAKNILYNKYDIFQTISIFSVVAQ